MKKSLNAQVALEFSFMMMLGFTFLIVVLSIISVLMIQKTNEQAQLIVKEEVLNVQQELLLATSVHDGYSREFEVPLKIANQNFAIIQSEALLEFRLENGASYTAMIPEIIGNVQKGTNSIEKYGVIIIT